MHISQTKRSVMAAAALLIVVFHLWIPVLPAAALSGRVERFVVAAGYLGVDLFFFLSAYTLSLADETPLTKRLRRRLLSVYPVFFLFSTLALAFGRLSFPRYLSTVIFVDFLRNGGGSFLWFLPALMMMYLAFPLCRRWLVRFRPGNRLLISLVVWVAGAFAVELGLKGVLDIGIFLCRIPVILLGVFLADYEGKFSGKQQLVFGTVLFLPGLLLVYYFGYLNKLNVPLSGMFYLAGLPCTLGLALLLDGFFLRFPSKAAKALGGATLELYCMQMLLGSELVQVFFRWTRSKLLTNVLVFLILYGLSLVLAWLCRFLKEYAAKRRGG